MSVKLRKRKNADGTTSLRLDIYKNGKRIIETLKHLQLAKPSNVADREHNKEKLKQAEAIAVTRAAELEANNYNMELDTGKNTVITVWMQSYVNTYSKKDKRSMQSVLNKFSRFLGELRKSNLTFGELQPLLIEDFVEYLEKDSIGEGARSYFNRFKKMLRYAYRKRIMKNNILDFVERKATGKARKKDILTLEELKLLSETPIQSAEIKKAFLFTCVTGLRWCDIKELKWKNINLKDKILCLTQSKTGEDVSVPLNDTALKLLGQAGKPGMNVFTLPSSNGCNKTLKGWVERAGITKHITWHNGRHSFGTNLIYNDVDVLTASKLLGHNSLRHTQRYVNTAAEMKQKATNKINIDI
jgi:integrase/recombinase XerD